MSTWVVTRGSREALASLARSRGWPHYAARPWRFFGGGVTGWRTPEGVEVVWLEGAWFGVRALYVEGPAAAAATVAATLREPFGLLDHPALVEGWRRAERPEERVDALLALFASLAFGVDRQVDADHVPILRAALADPVPAVRLTAVRLLYLVRPETAVSLLDGRRDAAIPGLPEWRERFRAALTPPGR